MGSGSLLRRLLGRDDAPGEPFLQEVRAGGASFREVVFTRNRRVMISVSDGGSTLRVHESFLAAPGEVRRAIGTMYGRGPAARRRAARDLIREHLRTIPPPPAPPRRGRRAPLSDRPHLARLREEFDRVNGEHFGGRLPGVPLWLSGRMRRRNGHFSAVPLEIVIARRLCTHAAAGEAERTLRHEMIHLWQHVEGEKVDHGRDFRRWAERLGVHPRATRTVEWAADC